MSDTVHVRISATLNVVTSVEMSRADCERLEEALAKGGRDANIAREELEGLVDWASAMDSFEVDDIDIEGVDE